MKRRDLIRAYAIATGATPAESRQAVDMVFAILRMALERGNGVTIRGFGEFVQSDSGIRFYQGFRVTGPDNSNPAA
ncbi:HU family DNA-binding protein [Solidesulfovibrio sp.]